MHTLPDQLVAAIRERIADPQRRHFRAPGERLGKFDDAQDVARLMDEGPLGNGDIFRDIVGRMKDWGHQNPAFHVIRGPSGEISASTDDKDAYPLASPAAESDLIALEAEVGRPLPQDVRQMWAIADGGWGPGLSFTLGHGPGLHSAAGARLELLDLRSRGPGYTGEMAWPDSLLPLTMTDIGMTSYDLDSGQIISFDEHWYDHDLAIEDAFSVTYLTLADFLLDWIED